MEIQNGANKAEVLKTFSQQKVLHLKSMVERADLDEIADLDGIADLDEIKRSVCKAINVTKYHYNYARNFWL